MGSYFFIEKHSYEKVVILLGKKEVPGDAYWTDWLSTLLNPCRWKTFELIKITR